MSVSKGQNLVVKVADWLAGYMAFGNKDEAIVLALWIMHTWVSERFDATPYLSITAASSQAGKSRLLNLVSWASRKGKTFADVTPAYLFTWMEQEQGKVTIAVDEAESLSGNALGVLRSLMNTGYLAGQTIGRKLPDGSIQDFPVYCPKAFACIGDVNPTLRSRSIVITLERGKPARPVLRRVEAMAEATVLAGEVEKMFAGLVVGPVEPGDWCEGRDAEIWAAIFGVATALKLDDAMMSRLVAVGSDLVGSKTAPRRRADVQESEDDATARMYGERAVRDLARVFEAGEKHVHSAIAVERMRKLPDGPWRVFKGSGLDERALAGLVSAFGVRSRQCQMGKGREGRSMAKGYSRADVLSSVPAVAAAK